MSPSSWKQELSVSTEQTHQQKSTTVVPTSKVSTRSRANADAGKEGQSAEEPNGATNTSPILLTSKESNSVQSNTIITNDEQRMHLLCNLSSLIYYNLFRYSCCLFSHLTELITTSNGPKRKRGGRRPTMGHGLHEYTRRHGGLKMQIESYDGARRPKDPVQAAKLNSACGIHIRSSMPLAKHWKEYNPKDGALKTVIPTAISTVAVSPLILTVSFFHTHIYC